MRLRKDIKMFVETELRGYNQTKQYLELIRQNIINESPIMDGQPKGQNISNPTEQRALTLTTNRHLLQMENTINAIEYVINSLPPEKIKLVKLKYWSFPRVLTDYGIAQELHCNERTVRRWALGIVIAIATEMGLINVVQNMSVLGVKSVIK